MNKLLISLIFVLLTKWNFCNGQEFSKGSLKYTAGVGASMGQHTEGLGLVFSVGYQREVWKDRLRLNPNLSFGYYSGKGVLDAPDVYFNSIGLQTNLYFDAIRYKSFSLVVGTGALVNNSRGLKGTGGDPGRTSSVYVSDVHAGGYFGAGFRINPPGKRIAFELMPINVYTDGQDFLEANFRIGLDVKLK